MRPPAKTMLAPLYASVVASLVAGCGCLDVDRDVYFFDLPIRELRVDSDDANVEVVGGALEQVRVVVHRWWTQRQPRVDLGLRGQVLDVGYGCPERQTYCAVQLDLMMPSMLDVTIRADDGDVLLSDITGTIEVEGDRSEVWGFRLGSPRVEVSTEHGDVTLFHTTAPELLSVTTSDGDIEVTIPAGPYEVIVESDKGEVLLSPEIEHDPSAANRIELSSEGGSIYVRASSEPES